MKFKHSKEFSIGLSVIIALVIVYFGIEYLKGNNVFKAANYYTTTYSEVSGLAQSAPVMLNGYKVGIVREVAYDYANLGHVKVEMSLDKELRLPEGTTAELSTDLLGTTSIVLKLGTGKTLLPTGAELPGAQAPSLMGNVTDNLLPAVGKIMPKIDSLVTSLNTLASNPALAASLSHMEVAMANIEASSIQLNAVMHKMPPLATDATVVMSNVKEMSTNLNTITTDLTTLSAQLKELPVDSTMNGVYQAVTTVNNILKRLNSSDSSLGMLLNDPVLYNNLANASASLDSLLRDVKKNPKRYISIKLL